MHLQFASIEHGPSSVPSWPQLLEALCHPPAHRVARTLGLTLRTVRRYNASGKAPKPVRLSLFWLTGWGRALINEQATADAQLAHALVRSLTDDVQRLEERVSKLLNIGHFGAANDPDPHPERPQAAPPSFRGKP